MKKIFLITLILIVSVITLASAAGSPRQKAAMEIPDLEEIRNRVTDINDEYYYPKLRKIYQQNALKYIW